MPRKPQLILLISLLTAACAVAPDRDDVGVETVAQSDSSLCKNALSQSQEKTALQLIDDICGDTWCEGDNNFAFDRLSCRAGRLSASNDGTCTLSFRIISRDDNPRSYPRSCTTGGFRGFDSLVETAPSGYQSLNWDYYLALTDCIDRLEAELPR